MIVEGWTHFVDLPPLLCFLLHKTSIDAWHDFVEVLAVRSRCWRRHHLSSLLDTYKLKVLCGAKMKLVAWEYKIERKVLTLEQSLALMWSLHPYIP